MTGLYLKKFKVILISFHSLLETKVISIF